MRSSDGHHHHVMNDSIETVFRAVVVLEFEPKPRLLRQLILLVLR
jgi:hypothetical protein